MSQPKIINDIVVAYKELKRKPTRGRYFGKHREVSPLCAWALYHGVKPKVDWVDGVVNSILGQDYRKGFESYWCGQGEKAKDIELYNRGRAHARIVERRLRKEGILSERS